MVFIVYDRQVTINDSKYGTTRVLFASTYTAKQIKTMYYSLNITLVVELKTLVSYFIRCTRGFISPIYFCPVQARL